MLYLGWLYQKLSKIKPSDYFISDAAKRLFQAWNHHLVYEVITEKNNAIALVYAKIESYTARLALWLHIVNHVARGEKPPCTVSGETMRAAIDIASFYLSQYKLILAHTGNSNKLEGNLLKIQNQAEKYYKNKNQGVGASFLKTRINSLKKMTTDMIRGFFHKLVEAGLGIIQGVGSKMVYIPFLNPGGGNYPGGGNNNGNGGNYPSGGNNNPDLTNCDRNGNNSLDKINNNLATGECYKSTTKKSANYISKTNICLNDTEKLIDSKLSPKVGAELVAPPIAKNETPKEIPKKNGEVGDIDSPQNNQNLFKYLPILPRKQDHPNGDTSKSTNFTNSSAESIDFNRSSAIEADHQSDHQSPIRVKNQIEVNEDKFERNRDPLPYLDPAFKQGSRAGKGGYSDKECIPPDSIRDKATEDSNARDISSPKPPAPCPDASSSCVPSHCKKDEKTSVDDICLDEELISALSLDQAELEELEIGRC